ncbi:hypothetical protein [Flavitalea sp.]|nr:hypothetical protein [Flavitalea sp.]
MAKLAFLLFLVHFTVFIYAQNVADTTTAISNSAKAEDPSQFFTRIEVFNELQYYKKHDFYLNQTIVRTIVKIGKRFTTRVDLPYVNNTFNAPAHYKTSGMGDISFRLLGFKFFESKLSAFTASMEISLNTAQSPILGTGKNLLIPVVSYSKVIPKRKMLLSLVLQQTNSVSGDEERADISFTKLQFIMVKTFSKRTWMVVAPEWFLDYINGGLSMNLRSRLGYVLTPRINAWITPSAGIFGDFAGRYQWSLDVGARYFLFKEMNLKKKNSG